MVEFPRSPRAVQKKRRTSVPSEDSKNAACSVTTLPNWSFVGSKVAVMIEELHEETLNPVLDNLGDKTTLFLKHCAKSVV